MSLNELGSHTVTTPDGRALEVVAAAGDGIALVMHHGTPDSSRVYPPFVEECAKRGVRLITYSRPGYGASTRHEGRTVADCAADVAAVADALGVGRLHTAGASGGGPHALAVAALLGDRVVSAATVASVAPVEAEGLDWLDGMGQENVDEFAAIDAGPEALERFLEAAAPGLREATGEDILAAIGEGLIGDADRRALTGDVAEHFAQSTRHALEPGIWGWFDDDVAFVEPWGFDLTSIAVPLTIWHGADDRFVPIAHGRWLASQLPRARTNMLDEHGHISLVTAYGDMVDDLLAARAS
jgi:pimeloyl-ACP methyl ester carboxylesterase